MIQITKKRISVDAAGERGPAGEGVPPGGTTGQVLTKIDETDYNTEWTDKTSSSNPFYLNEFVRIRADGRHYYLEIKGVDEVWHTKQHFWQD